MEEIIEIDVRGLRCPLPVLRLRKALMGVAPGASVRILADDPVAVIDIPHFCQSEGHDLQTCTGPENSHAYLVRRGPAQPRDGAAPRD